MSLGKDVLRPALVALRTFATARRGNVAVITAIAAIPILAACGAAADYGHASAVHTEMQAALDATALALSAAAPTLTSSELQSKAQSYFASQFDVPDASHVSVTASYLDDNGSIVVVRGSASLPTYFMGIMGYRSMLVGASSTVKSGTTRLRVALVLDNTGSMAQSGKMTALKTATKSLLAQLQGIATENGDINVAIIPFVKDVNVGWSNYNAPWIDWTDWNAANGTCSSSTYHAQSDCTSAGKTWTTNNHNGWNGCVVDRGDETGPDPANYDTNVVTPTTTITATLWPAEQYSSCPQAATGLSSSWSAMASLVNNMSPNGNTNQAIGLALGWMSLVGGGPFTVPSGSSSSYSSILILLTDGLNTQDRWYSNQSQIDARQTLTCSNIKASGITLYTVQVSTDGTPLSPLLQSCASDPAKFFYLTSSSEIVTTFNSISTNISNLYVAK